MSPVSKKETLLIEQDKDSVTIRLNRPKKHNALNDQLVRDLKGALQDIESEPGIKSVVIRGNGKSFCSGADLAYLKSLSDYDYAKNLQDSRSLADLFLKIYSFPKPVIAFVHGAALAGGCGLTSVCDFILATNDARFGYPEVRIGFIAALVSTFLIRQIGERKARELLLTGKVVSAEQAFDLGLINQTHNPEDAEMQLDALKNDLHQNSTEAMAVSKQKLLNQFIYQSIEQDLEGLSEINAKFRETEHFIEGISSFIEKRKPNWK
ncbi:MAG: hypothetical protein GF313_10415 [Caldithrix sp.]|nr:hypothetical protein [Caldithrix sp.]